MRRAARASLPKALYPRASLAAAALALGERARASLGSRGRRWTLELEAAGRGDAEALLGELLNEALAHARRQALLKEERALVGAVVGRLLAKGFPAAEPDPLEQLEPQVRRDRDEETAALLARARGKA